MPRDHGRICASTHQTREHQIHRNHDGRLRSISGTTRKRSLLSISRSTSPLRPSGLQSSPGALHVHDHATPATRNDLLVEIIFSKIGRFVHGLLSGVVWLRWIELLPLLTTCAAYPLFNSVLAANLEPLLPATMQVYATHRMAHPLPHITPRTPPSYPGHHCLPDSRQG